MLPGVDHPEAFGQHPNADIASQITETRTLFDTLLSLQPQVSVKQGESRESKVGFLSSCHYHSISRNDLEISPSSCFNLFLKIFL